MYVIMGLGNPGAKYEKTRHNVGFLVVNAFAQKNLASSSFQLHTKANAFVLEDTWNQQQLVLVKPQTFMNNSGKAAKTFYKKYNIQDWLSSIPGTLTIRQKHIQNIRGIFENPFSKVGKTPAQKSISSWTNKSTNRHFIVVHDDIDLPLGKVKISLGSSSGGHRGVESIIQETKTKEFARIRVGIQPENGKPANTQEFVVQQFTPEETSILNQVVLNAVHIVELIITEGIETAMQEYN